MNSLLDLEGYKIGCISDAVNSKSVSTPGGKEEHLSNLFDRKTERSTVSIVKASSSSSAKDKGKQHLKTKISKLNNGIKNNQLKVKNKDKKESNKGSSTTNPNTESHNDEDKIENNRERLERTVFVGNVPVSSSRKELKKLFSKYGRIENVRIRSAPVSNSKTKSLMIAKKVAVIKKDFHDGRQGLNAYVVFKEKDSCASALQSSGEEFNGLHLRVDLATKREPDHRRSIFVGNIPFNTEEEELRAYFKDCGDVESVRIIRDKTTGLGKGFGYVLFKKVDGVIFGLKMNHTEFKTRKIRVYRSMDKSKMSTNSKFREKKFGGMKGTSSRVQKFRTTQKLTCKKVGKNKQNAMTRIKNKPSFSKKREKH